MADVVIDGYQINLLGGYAAEFASKYNESNPKPANCTVPLAPYTPVNPSPLDLVIPDCKTTFAEIPMPDPYISIPCIPTLTANVTFNGSNPNVFEIVPLHLDMDGHPCQYQIQGNIGITDFCQTSVTSTAKVKLHYEEYNACNAGDFNADKSASIESSLSGGCAYELYCSDTLNIPVPPAYTACMAATQVMLCTSTGWVTRYIPATPDANTCTS